MDVHYSDKLKHAFVIRDSELKKLTRLLQDRIGKVHISVDCVDGFSREFNTLKDLIAYENSKSKRIHRIRLRAQSDDFSKSATIAFCDSSWFKKEVSLDVNGREDVVSRLKEGILDVIAGMRPWYNVIARVNFFIAVPIECLTLYFIAVIAVEFKSVSLIDSPVSHSTSSWNRIAIMPLSVLGAYSLELLRGYLFPKIVFVIGQGESRFRLLEKVRWGVIIALLVSIVAGIITRTW